MVRCADGGGVRLWWVDEGVGVGVGVWERRDWTASKV